MDKYISIKEFAHQVGVSSQAIYQRLDKDLKPFLKVVDNKKKLDIRAFRLFNLENVEQQIDKETDKELTKILQETLRVLSRQLEAKDQQISDLNKRLKEAQELNKNNQILLGGEQSRTNPSLRIGDVAGDRYADEVPEKRGFFARMFKKK
jgi:DNA-binding transcriptional MerR regulator